MMDKTHHKIHDAIHIRPHPYVSDRMSAQMDENWPFINFSLAVYSALATLEVRQAL